MADPEVHISALGEDFSDVEMQGDGDDVEVGGDGEVSGIGPLADILGGIGEGIGETAAPNGDSENEEERLGAEDGKPAPRATFVEYVFHAVVMLAWCDFD